MDEWCSPLGVFQGVVLPKRVLGENQRSFVHGSLVEWSRMWVWNVLDHLSDVISFRPQLADTSGFWMFLDVFGTYRAKIGSRSRPEDPKDLTRVPSLVSPRHGKQYSLLEPLGCNRICHTDRVCKRGFLYVSMRISGTKHDAKLRRLTYIYIYSIYNPKKHPDFTWLHLFWMGNGPMAKAICGKLRSPSEVPRGSPVCVPGTIATTSLLICAGPCWGQGPSETKKVQPAGASVDCQ